MTYEGPERREERTCCDDCDRKCPEHDIRMEMTDDVKESIKEVVADMTAQDRRITSVERGQVIFLASLVVLVGVAVIGWNAAETTARTLSQHIEATSWQTRQVQLTNEADLRQDSEIKALAVAVGEIGQTLKSIDQRLARLERGQK